MDILARAVHHLYRTSVISGGRLYTYENVLSSSDRISNALGKLIDKPFPHEPPRVGLYAAPGAEYLAGTLAIWRAGGIVVPLATSHPPRELSYVLEDAGICAVLMGEEHAPKLAELSSRVGAALHVMEPVVGCATPGTSRPSMMQDARAIEAPGAMMSSRGLASEDGALIIYTSGTTGRPKGVLHSHRSLRSQMDSLVHAWQWSASDTILHPLPLHHIHGIVNALYCPAYVGATVSFSQGFRAPQVWQEIMDSNLTVFMGVPTMYSLLLSHYDSMPPEQQASARRAAAALRLTISGSSACPVPIMERWKELTGSYLLERYGMTEIGMALSNPYRGPRCPGTVGSPLPGVSVKVQEDGELLVRGGNLFSEYWGREQATREAFTPDGWFKTGDSAEAVAVSAGPGEAELGKASGLVSADDGKAGRSDGVTDCYRILGRTSVDIIKSSGFKISALMIESVLLEHPGVDETAVIGVPDEVYGEVVTALVVRRPGYAGLGHEELTTFCRDRLAAYQAPRRWRFVERLPRNAMGKLNKKELLKDFMETAV